MLMGTFNPTYSVTPHSTGPDKGGGGRGPGPQASHQQRASHQTVHILFLANDRCLRDYDLVVAHCYPRRARSALGVDTVLTLDVCMYVCLYVCMYVRALERKRLIGMT